MPPARKDPPQADDSSLPSTSRAFSPSLAPPPKRARTSMGRAPSCTTSRKSTGGRQARIEDFIDEKDLQDRLLFATMETADEIIEEEEKKENVKMEIEKEVISEAANIVWNALAEDWATDLIAFSRHAGRETIREDDVKLLMRRNPDMLAEILAECEGDEDGEGGGGGTTGGTTKRKSTGGVGGRRRKEARDEEKMEILVVPSDDVTTPRGGASSSMDSVVPETPQGIVPVAHSTPMNGRSVSMIGRVDFSIPSPIGEIEEEKGRRIRGGRRPNRSILDDLSATIREGNGENEREGEGGPGASTQELDEMDHNFASIMDIRHPREQEDERRRMRMEEGEGEGEGNPNQLPGPSTNQQGYGRVESPELFGEDRGEKKEEEHDSFDDDDDVIFEDKENDRKGRGGDKSDRMSESSVLREMLDEEEEEKDKTVIEKERKMEDSFDEEIQIVEVKKNENKVVSPLPMGHLPSSSAANARAQSGGAAARAVPGISTTSIGSSQESFYNDDIVDDPPPPPPPATSVPVSTAAPIVHQPAVAAAALPVRPDGYDSFDEDDDFISVPSLSRSKENTTPKAIAGPSPTITVANRWSTVEVEEVLSPAAEKKNGNPRKVFAEDIFGLNDLPAPSKPTPVNKPSLTVPIRPSPAAIIHQKPSPTVPTIPPSTVHPKPAVLQSTVKKTHVNKDVPSTGFSSFSFFDSQEAETPTPKREDSDFVDIRSKPTTSATKTTPKWRGGARGGRGFPRRVDPNSKVNRMIREQSTPVRLSPRPPSRISEVIGSFEDDDFDVSGFDD
ncbi:hypothetical protein PENTCL1PPCAC_6265 [Pristionchus entomophagus]|uniref:Centromere protein S n=1 Tax=Pristionchus entomophagus TaxID=358040 RepID=A0AAV5SVJ8_9BILA|nr:hypothetical protein PENTCL1PPCAC_6265 [Pristionchus entomophagus]